MFLTLAPIVLILESYIWFKVIVDHLADPTLYGLAHILLSLACIIVAVMSAIRIQGDRVWLSLLALFVIVMGPMGAFGALFSFLMNQWYRRGASTFEEWYNSLFPEGEIDAPQALVDQLEAIKKSGAQSGDTADTAQFQDVLSFGEQRQKLAMLALISREFSPIFSPLLNRALADPDNAVRVQAATAVTHVEHRFTLRSQYLQKRIKETPDDAPLLLEAARHFDDYAFTGLLDAVRERQNRELALDLYKRYLALKPDDLSARTAVGRNLLRDGRHQEAADFLRSCFEGGYGAPQLALWFMEALFSLQQFEELESVAREYGDVFRDRERYNLQINEAIALWVDETALEDAA
ncbi:hypothetical protein MAIT1_03025 [Magnetofaba australis IT-1]|uniref:Uncharacterized protein n=2 Tax=Magnetofaba TaxID=1472292 RepID=A0A1Y2K6D8_9PROT|nr:hypothetical protein MAIT1_03025 [Magnetofaba australis IT-1]